MKIKGTFLSSLIVGAFLFPAVAGAVTPPPTPMPMIMPPMSLADGVVYERSDIVVGFEAYKDPFYIGDAGMYQATLTDFQFPSEFDYLGLMITHGTTKVGVVEGPGSFTFNADPGMYNAFFVGSMGGMNTMPGSPAAMVGSYGIQVALVPELETWLMMIVGLAGVGYWLRRQQRSASRTHFRVRTA